MGILSLTGYSSTVTPLDMLGDWFVAVMLIAAVYSLVQCYFGYIIFRVILVIQGVINGLAIGAGLGALCVGGQMSDGRIFVVVIVAIVAGILGGVLAHFLYKLSVFMYFFVISALIVSLLGELMVNFENAVPIVIGVILGVIFGILGVIFDKYIIIASTSFGYGILAGTAIGLMTNAIWLGVVLALLFSVTGFIAQIVMNKKKNKQNPAATAAYPLPNGYPQSVPVQVCQNCGSYVQIGSPFCTYCGAPIAPVQYSQPAAVQSVPAAPVQYSQPAAVQSVPAVQPTASAPVYSQPQAPEAVQPENHSVALYCSSCGALIGDSGAMFCDNCGSKL